MRKCKDFIQSYMKYSEQHDAPAIFNKWCALLLLSAIVLDKVGIVRKFYYTTPNIYLLLLGNPGIGKGTAMSLILDLYNKTIEEDKSNLICGRIQPEKLLQELAKKRNLILQTNEASMLFSDRSHTGLMIPTLCDLFDGVPTGNYTKTSGVDIIKDCCFVLLTGSTYSLLQPHLNLDSIGGGFTSRAMIIECNEKKKTDAFFNAVDLNVIGTEYSHLLDDLKEINKLKGQIKWSDAAQDWFIKWEAHHEEQYSTIADNLLTGIHARTPIYLTKIGMLLSVSESDKMFLEVRHLEEALKLVSEGYKFNKKLLESLSMSKFGEFKAKMLLYIKKKKEVTHTELLTYFSRQANAHTVKEVESCLVDECIVEVSKDRPITYKYLSKIERNKKIRGE